MDHLIPHYPSIRTSTAFARMGHVRSDKGWVSKQRQSPRAVFMVFVDSEPVLSHENLSAADATSRVAIKWFQADELEALGLESHEAFFLGNDTEDRPRFAFSLYGWFVNKSELRRSAFEDRANLRSLAIDGEMSPEDLSTIGQAKALVHWNETHQCCGKCGAKTKPRDGGWRRQCWSCQQNYFPRSDPAVIMLVTDGSRFILGKEERFQNRFMSIIAGFVEPGESIENAVRRETMEETGIEVGNVQYVASQPWPFPHNIMIGCRGEALTTEFQLHDSELMEARWVDREEAKLMLADKHPEEIRVPPPISIAHMLISQFVDGLL